MTTRDDLRQEVAEAIRKEYFKPTSSEKVEIRVADAAISVVAEWLRKRGSQVDRELEESFNNVVGSRPLPSIFGSIYSKAADGIEGKE